MENLFGDNDWEEIIPETDIWKPEVGDVFMGIYIKMTPNSGNWNKNKYTFKTGEGERHIYGTTDLDNKMALAKVGEAIKIKLHAKIKQRAPKKDFLHFKVWRKAIGQKATEASKDEAAASTPQGAASKPPATPDKTNMAEEDDSEARETINLIKKEVGQGATPEMIVEHALKVQEDWELSENDITRIKKQALKG